jgi:DNA repair protein RadC
MTTLYVRDQSGFREAQPTDVLDRAQALLAQRYRTGSPVLTSPALTREFLRVHLGSCEHEVFGVLHLDSRHRLIAVENLFRGTISSASVHPREVVKATLKHNAAAVVLYHNHPSGLSEPSAADELITRRRKEALALIDVRVLDHLLGGFGSVTTAAKMHQSLGFRESIANKGFKKRTVTLLVDLRANFRQARTAPRETGLAERLVTMVRAG